MHFGDKGDACRQHSRRQQRRAPSNQTFAEPEHTKHSVQATKERWQPVRPNRISLRNPHGLGGRSKRHLQPIDTDRLAVTRLGAIHDPHVIARLEHLLASLRKSALVAIRWR